MNGFAVRERPYTTLLPPARFQSYVPEPRLGRQSIQRAGYLFLPAFRWVTAARDLAGLVEPLAVHLDPRGVLLSLSRHLHRIAHLLLPVLGENDLRGGSVAVHDDE